MTEGRRNNTQTGGDAIEADVENPRILEHRHMARMYELETERLVKLIEGRTHQRVVIIAEWRTTLATVAPWVLLLLGVILVAVGAATAADVRTVLSSFGFGAGGAGVGGLGVAAIQGRRVLPPRSRGRRPRQTPSPPAQ